MSINVNDKNLGHATAYAYYKAGGGTMTEAEFTEFMADFGTASQTAVEAAQAALASKNAAQTAATTATNKASEATTAATTATNKAAEAQADADAAALDASQAMSAASTATTKAAEATTAAATATSAKTDAVAANTAAQSAKTAAQTAQTDAETAAASVSASAAQIATNTEDITQLKSDLTTTTQVIPISITEKNKYINLSASSADVNSPTTSSTGFCYSLVPCSEGDAFVVNAEGGASSRAWGFVKSDGVILAKASASITVVNLLLIAPKDSAYLVINDKSGATSYKGLFVKDEIKSVNSKLEYIANTSRLMDYIPLYSGNMQTGSLVMSTDRCYSNAMGWDVDTKIYFDDTKYKIVFLYYQTGVSTPTIGSYILTSPADVKSAGKEPATFPTIRLQLVTLDGTDIDTNHAQETTYIANETTLANKGSVLTSAFRGTAVTVGEGGNYANLRDCFDKITPSKTNPYTVILLSGIHDIRSLYTSAERTAEGFKGLFVPNFVKLVGQSGKKSTIIQWDGSSDTQNSNISVLNIRSYATLQGITIIGKNIRYVVHDDFETSNVDNIRCVYDCDFVGDSLALNAVYGSGTGGNGAKWHFKDCSFQGSNLIAFMQHNSVNVSKASYTKFENCRFKGALNNTVQFASYNSGVSAENEVTMYGCKISTPSGTASKIYINEAGGSGIKYRLSGFATTYSSIEIDNSDGVDYSSNIDFI